MSFGSIGMKKNLLGMDINILVNAFNCRFQLWIADAFNVYCTDGNYLRL